MKIPRLLLCALAALALTHLAAASPSESYAVSDPIQYSGWNAGSNPMSANWTYHNGNTPALISGTPTPASVYFTINNGVIYTPLSRVLNTDFELSLDASHSAYQRCLWVGLFNDDGTQGYALRWDSTVFSQWGSAGLVSIRKYSVTAPSTANLTFSTAGTVLGTAVASGHNPGNTTTAATSLPFARLRLTWSRDTGTLALYVNDVLKQTVIDTSFTTFSRLYVGGNTGSKFDNISASVPCGATAAFTTIEAESTLNATNGAVVAMTTAPAANIYSPEQEASGRSFVQLSATGHHLTIPNVPASNALVLRHCIPDAPAGGGLTATLNLYVNGTFRQTLTLSSRNNWLYSTPGANGQSNAPTAGAPHVFWAESAHVITGGLNAGDSLTLQKDAANTASYYRIDLLDLDAIPSPLPPPAAGTYYSVATYGANGADDQDDSAAITTCIAAAKAAGKTVWIPAGTYRQTQRFTVDGVTIQGAGMWHTKILGMTGGTNWGGTMGFDLQGNAPRVSDLKMESDFDTYRNYNSGKAFTGSPSNWRVEDVWIANTVVGFWMNTASTGIVRDCRVRGTYADAINIGRGSTGNLIENNHVRGCGDDGIAILSETEYGRPPSTGNTARYNTVAANWWGHNGNVSGGENNVFEYNYLSDNALLAGFTINLAGSWPMHPMSASVIRRNIIARGGGNHAGQQRGAIWTYAATTTINGVSFLDNYIKDSVFRGIHLTGPKNQQAVFERNLVESPGGHGILVSSEATGSGTFTQNTVLDVPSGSSAFLDNAAGYTPALSGNNF